MKKFFFIAALALFGFTASAKAQEAVFVVHPEQAATAVTLDDVKHILLGNLTKWRHGAVIKLVVLTEGATHTKVIRDHTQRTPDQFDKFWKRQVFTGAGVMPAQFKTDADVIAYVAANPGAFGYVAKDSATTAVKILGVQ